MPVRSLTSPVLRWPAREAVRAATRKWGFDLYRRDGVVRVGSFGSLVTGRWGVGSDVDLVVLVAGSSQPPHRRSLEYDASELPVPADVLVFTTEEWDRLAAAGREPLGPVEWIDPT